jgi:hypothetical protein
MKTVRYMISAAALTPAAWGLAGLPAGSHAVPAHAGHGQVGAEPAKVVFMGAGKRVAGHVAGISPDTCTGTTGFNIPKSSPNPNIKGHGWYTEEANNTECIGTVKVSMYYTKNVCKWARLLVGSGAGQYVGSTGSYCGHKSYWYIWSFGVHKIYPNGTYVCARSRYQHSFYNFSNCAVPD